jgi:hypothetical protein
MKFCCSNFEGNYLIKNGFAPNIRIVKFTSEFLISQNANKEFKSKRNDLRYFVTMGYDTFKLDLPLMNINYCPYCGTNLYEFYNKDEHANEIEGETFKL